MTLEHSIVRKGKLVSPQIVKLDEPAQGVSVDVEVVLHSAPASDRPGETIFEYLARLEPGTKSREELDGYLAEERDAWEDR